MNEDTRVLIAHPGVKWGIIASVVFLAAFLGMKTLTLVKEYPYVGSNVPVTNAVTVSGTGEVFAVPDVATFTFSVTEEAATVDDAQKQATEKINRIVDYLKGEGVDEKDIKTTAYNVYPRYEYTQTTSRFGTQILGERRLAGFNVSQSIGVKVRDTDKAGTLLSSIGEYGATNISGLQFTIDDEEALKEEARSKAIENARAKAAQLAKELDVTLLRVVSFSEYNDMPYYEYAKGGYGGALDATFAASAPEIPTGENKITMNVSITYEIR